MNQNESALSLKSIQASSLSKRDYRRRLKEATKISFSTNKSSDSESEYSLEMGIDFDKKMSLQEEPELKEYVQDYRRKVRGKLNNR